MDADTLLVLALVAIPNPQRETWEVVAEKLSAEDRAALRIFRDELLRGGIADGQATRLNQLTGATTTLSGRAAVPTHTDGTT
jgi:hypothetical protein